jgi:hypothetical protein
MERAVVGTTLPPPQHETLANINKKPASSAVSQGAGDDEKQQIESEQRLNLADLKTRQEKLEASGEREYWQAIGKQYSRRGLGQRAA